MNMYENFNGVPDGSKKVNLAEVFEPSHEASDSVDSTEVNELSLNDQIEDKKKILENLNRGVQDSSISLEEAEPQVLQIEDEIRNLESQQQEQINEGTIEDKKQELEDLNRLVQSSGALSDDIEKKVINLENDIRTMESSDDSIDEGESNMEAAPSYLELKRSYKESKRAYEAALEQDVENRSALKKMFGLGRKNLSPETQALYEASMEAERTYYQSFLETQKDKVEERLNKYNESEETVSVVPSLVKRHITNPAEARFEAQKRELPPQIQSILEQIKGNKVALAALSTAGLSLKGLSILSSFGVGLAAGAGTRWTMNKIITGQEERLKEKTETFNEAFESGEWEDLSDIKNEYFQDLRKIDDRKLQANLAAAGVAVAAGSSVHDAMDSAANFDVAFAEEVGESVGSTEALAVDNADVAGAETVESESASETLTPEEKEQTPTVIREDGFTFTQEDIDSFSDPNAQENYQQVSPERLAELTEKAEARNEWIDKKIEELKSQPGNSDALNYRLEKIAESAWRHAQYLEISEKMGMDLKPGDPLSFTVGTSGPPSINGEPIPLELYKDLLEAERPQDFKWEKIQIEPQEDSSIVSSEFIVDSQETVATESASVEINHEQQISEAIAIAERMGMSVDGIPDYRVEDGVIVEIEGQYVAEEYRAVELSKQSTAYEIKSGDTLSEIAEANNVSIKELMDVNPDITNPHEINAGQEIKIPAETGSSVYDGGVGLGGPGSEGFDSGVGEAGQVEASKETETLPSETVTETPEPIQSQQDASSEYMKSPESAPMGDILSDMPKPEAQAEVPDYSGDVPVTEAEASEIAPDETSVEEEIKSQSEAISGKLREASPSEIFGQQKSVQDFIVNMDIHEGQMYLLKEYDDAGYEPLYTSSLTERTIDVDSVSKSENFSEKPATSIIYEMINAYKAGEISLPAQWVYTLDILGDNKVEPDSVLEGATDWDSRKLNSLAGMVAEDLNQILDLPSEEIKELGISSGQIDEVSPGDKIQIGEIIKIIMQNASDRLNK